MFDDDVMCAERLLVGAGMEESKSLDSSTGIYAEVDMLDDGVFFVESLLIRARKWASKSADCMILRLECMLKTLCSMMMFFR